MQCSGYVGLIFTLMSKINCFSVDQSYLLFEFLIYRTSDLHCRVFSLRKRLDSTKIYMLKSVHAKLRSRTHC